MILQGFQIYCSFYEAVYLQIKKKREIYVFFFLKQWEQ